ncbi:MAG: DUF3021 family protein [Clostridiales bacterium]|nr:DUF3021 family protein [Clostridiales bacterium]
MEDNKTIFSYLGELFATYGIIMLMFIILNLMLGDTAKGYSSFFEYGRGNLSTNTMLQLFLFAVIVCVTRNVFLTDRLIKKMSILARNLVFFLTITAVMIVFIILFAWFPVNDISAWIGFVISFAVCSAIGILISKLKEKAENQKMAQALERFQNEEKTE